MSTIHQDFRGSGLPGMLSALALLTVLAGCGQAGNDGADSNVDQPLAQQSAGDERPLGEVTEFEGFTLRANVGPTQTLSDAMAQRYAIDAGPDVFMLNLVILQKRADQQPLPVLADVEARYETLIGHSQTIEMRPVEADGSVSYIGTLDTSSQRIFRFVIEAQPAGTDLPLSMNFEVQLPALDTE